MHDKPAQTNTPTGNTFVLAHGKTTLQLTVITADVLRFRYLPDSIDEGGFSYARIPEEEVREHLPAFEDTKFKAFDDRWELSTPRLHVTVSKGMHVTIRNRYKQIICEDERGFTHEENTDFGGHKVRCTKLRRSVQEFYYGLGDKAGDANLAHKRFTLWNSDAYGYEPHHDPLYKSIPFFMAIHEGDAYGIFFDNPFRATFDFGYEQSNVFSFSADGGEMDYYFIYGPMLKDVAARYAMLTGTPALPPMWALGYQQSKMSYYPADRVLEIAREFRKRRIPCDVLYLDFDYLEKYKSFTWDKERFPDPAGMHQELSRGGFHTVAIINPCVKVEKGFAVYDEGLENDYFSRRADGPLTRATVWENESHFPDFTAPPVRRWWGDLHAHLLDKGVAGVWNDMNEPTAFRGHAHYFPLDSRHDYDGHPCSHRKAHNVYGMQMCRATYLGLQRLQPEKRPFVLTRAMYAGTQRYAATWTGDNVASWRHLWLANVQTQRLSISGVSFCGTDIGGFLHEPSGELYLRWMQLAVFHPLMRTHSSGDTADQEPWSFGDEVLTHVKSAIELRYKLLPYLYTLFHRYVTTGTPMLLPLPYLDQFNPDTYHRMDEFGLGEDLFICPIYEEGATTRRMFLPKGNWYHYFTGKKQRGKIEIEVETPLDHGILFVREGAIIPHFPVLQYVGEKNISEVTLRTYHKLGSHESEWYEDAGEGHAHLTGEYRLHQFESHGTASHVQVAHSWTGTWENGCNTLRFAFVGLPFTPTRAEADGQPIDVAWHEGEQVWVVRCPKDTANVALWK